LTRPAGPVLPPALSPRRSSRAGWLRYGRALSWVAFATSLLVLVGATSTWAYVRHLDGKITRLSNVLCLGRCTYTRPAEAASTENFLLVGTDSRAGVAGTDLAGTANDTTGGERSDTTLLVHISSDTKRVVVLSFPRDMLVQTPAYTTKSGTAVPAQPAKFNAAISVGGPSLLVQQVEGLTGLRVDHYVSVDLLGFSKIVDALGGVNVCLSVPARDPGSADSGGSGFAAPAGVNHLDGFRALQYVRQRDGLQGGDLGRIARQHRFLAAVFSKLKSNGTLLNPIKLNDVLSSIISDIKTDNKTSLTDLTTLGTRLKGLAGGSVEYLTVPVNEGPQLARLGAVLYADQTRDKAIFQAIADDQDPEHPTPIAAPTTSAGPAAAPGTVTVAPSAVSLAVQNGAGVTGLGAKAATALRGLGFTVTSTTTARATGGTTTTVRYGPNRGDSARTVAAAVPGATLTADPTLGADALVLVVGTDYTGVRPVTVGAPGRATTAPPAQATPSVPATPVPSASADVQASTSGPDCGP